MTLLRSLVDDLVAKRLWPIALLLAITAVAVPVALGGSGAGAPAAPPATVPADGAAASTPAVEIVGPAAVRGRSGTVRDPFRRSKPSGARTATDDGAPAQKSAASQSGSNGSAADSDVAPTTTGGAPVTATPTGGVAAGGEPAASAASVYRPRVRWGQDEHAAAGGISRLQPLGGSSNPALVYLGTTKGGARAVFLLGPNASADGDGTCAEKTCRIIELKSRDTTTVSVQGEEGAAPRRFELAIDGIVRRAAAGEAAAAKLRARVHRGGRDVLREMIKDSATAAAIGQFRFDRTQGAVIATTAP